MSEAKEIRHIKPLNPRIAFSHEYESSDYPDILRIPMEDGKVITYRREIEQPEPRVTKAIDLIRIMKENTYGGQGYLAKHAKK